MIKNKSSDIRDVIVERMREDGRTWTWLAEKTGIPYNTLMACLKRKQFSLSQSNLDKINNAIGTDYAIPA